MKIEHWKLLVLISKTKTYNLIIKNTLWNQ